MSLLLPAAICAFLVSALICGVLSLYRGRWALLDRPNARSLHAKVVPRSGGLGILAGIAVGFYLAGVHKALPGAAWAGLALILVAGVSVVDDLHRLPAAARLPVHFAAAAALVYAGAYAPAILHLFPGIQISGPAWLLEGFCLLFIVWMVNLYNFMDGMDGFAGGMAVMGFGTLALLGWLAGAPSYAAAALLVALAAAGFLAFNFPPARIFMGDTGSGSLGLLAALFMLWAERAGLFPLWVGTLVFSPFIVDATWTVLRRTARGEKPWTAHREHYYQRLVRLGWGHRRTVLWSYALMLKCSLLALAGFCFTAIEVQGAILGFAAAAYLALMAYVNALERGQPSH
ncbi:MAG: MraY family glycosyltransferase [Bacillota bacterium]